MIARSLIATLLAASVVPAQSGTEQRLQDALRSNARAITLEGTELSGPGADFLLAEARASRFLLLGESHGNQETPAATRALLKALRDDYDVYAIETGPCATEVARRVATDKGVAGVVELTKQLPFSIAFFQWREEIEAFGAALELGYDVWGLDQEFIGAPRLLLRELAATGKGDAVTLAASWSERANAGFTHFAKTGKRDRAFFSVADDETFDQLAEAFADSSAGARMVDELRQSWIIYRHYNEKRFFQNNHDRIRLMKRHLAERLAAAPVDAKVLFRFGSAHMGRGLSPFDQYDLGNMASELAVASGSDSLHVFVFARGSVQPDGSTKSYAQQSPHLAPLLDLAGEGGVVVDLRPLRPLLSTKQAKKRMPAVHAFVFRFDAAVVFPTFHPSTALVPMPKGV